ncbi:hypothetical protein ACQUW5_09690 [Legionella sp. CNM-1927-20]|uniref:hypothetical protein n=1 Tax=Legionella sp. CNM-1927-20 TaxID=3422221 RepID=UPI00403AB165
MPISNVPEQRLLYAAGKGLPKTVAEICRKRKDQQLLNIDTIDKAIEEAINAGLVAKPRPPKLDGKEKHYGFIEDYASILQVLTALRLSKIKFIADSFSEIRTLNLPAKSIDTLLVEITKLGIDEAEKGNEGNAEQCWQALAVLCSLKLESYSPSTKAINEVIERLAINQQSKALSIFIKLFGRERVIDIAIKADARDELAKLLEESTWDNPPSQDQVDQEFKNLVTEREWYKAITLYFTRAPSPSPKVLSDVLHIVYARNEWDTIELLLSIGDLEHDTFSKVLIERILEDAIRGNEFAIVKKIFSKVDPASISYEQALKVATDEKRQTEFVRAVQEGEESRSRKKVKPHLQIASSDECDRALNCLARLQDWDSVSQLLKSHKPGAEAIKIVFKLAFQEIQSKKVDSKEKLFAVIKQLVILADSQSKSIIPNKNIANALFYQGVQEGDFEFIKKLLFLNPAAQPSRATILEAKDVVTKRAISTRISPEDKLKAELMVKFLTLQLIFADGPADLLGGIKRVLKTYLNFNENRNFGQDYNNEIQSLRDIVATENDPQALIEKLSNLKELEKNSDFSRYRNFIVEKVRGPLIAAQPAEKGDPRKDTSRSEIYFQRLPKASEIARMTTQIELNKKLTTAAENQEWKTVATLLNSQQQPNYRTANQLLSLAARNGQFGIIKQLFKLDISNRPTQFQLNKIIQEGKYLMRVAEEEKVKDNIEQLVQYLTNQNLIYQVTNPLKIISIILENYTNTYGKARSQFFPPPITKKIRELINTIKQNEKNSKNDDKLDEVLRDLNALRQMSDKVGDKKLTRCINFIEEQIPKPKHQKNLLEIPVESKEKVQHQVMP